jgi:predicted PurR-regulated permease PerM
MLDRRTIRILATALAFSLLVAVVYIARTVLIVFAFSILFAYLINPAVRVLQRYSLFFKDLRGPHIFQAYLVFLILFALLVHAFAPEFHTHADALVGEIPALADRLASGEIATSVGQSLRLTHAQIGTRKSYLQQRRSDIESAKAAVQRSAFKTAAVFLSSRFSPYSF